MVQTDSDMKIRILLAAKKLFAQRGFDGTSVRQICEEAGANVALVSYYFGGKENVFRSLFEYFFPGQRMSQYSELLKEPVLGLALLVKEVVRFSMNDQELSSILEQEIFKKSPRIEAVTSFTFPVWLKVRDLLELGKAQGKFHFTSTDQAFMMVVGIALAHKKWGYFSPIMSLEEGETEETAHQAAAFVLTALGAQVPENLHELSPTMKRGEPL